MIYESPSTSEKQVEKHFLREQKKTLEKFCIDLIARINDPYDRFQLRKPDITSEQSAFIAILSSVCASTFKTDMEINTKAKELFIKARELFPENGDFPRVERLLWSGVKSKQGEIMTAAYFLTPLIFNKAGRT